MAILFILTMCVLLSGIFVLAICGVAARPMPQPPAANSEEREFTQTRIRHRLLPATSSPACLLLAGLLWAGCAASRSYPGPVHGPTFNGTIQSIDLQNHRLTLTPLKPGDATVFVWEDSTKFLKNGVPLRPESLEPTWPVRVHYHTASGQLIAHHIYVQAAYPVIH